MQFHGSRVTRHDSNPCHLQTPAISVMPMHEERTPSSPNPTCTQPINFLLSIERPSLPGMVPLQSRSTWPLCLDSDARCSERLGFVHIGEALVRWHCSGFGLRRERRRRRRLRCMGPGLRRERRRRRRLCCTLHGPGYAARGPGLGFGIYCTNPGLRRERRRRRRLRCTGTGQGKCTPGWLVGVSTLRYCHAGSKHRMDRFQQAIPLEEGPICGCNAPFAPI